MRWISAAAHASAAALLLALLSQALDWPAARSWFLLAWTILLLPVVLGLFQHPMRWPAWGLFIGFWGAVGAIWLIVLQVLAAADVLRQPAYGAWVAWPLALIGIWVLVASGLGLGNGTFSRVIDVLGILTAAGLLGISIATWVSAPDAARLVAGITALLYATWAVSVGVVFWRLVSASPAARPGSVAAPLAAR